MKEVSKEYIQKQKVGFVFWIYHPLTKQMRKEVLSKDSIVYSRYCYEGLIFYIR